MKIQDLFARNIHRPINGVVKADQDDASTVWQELDEFVVTREVNRHINDLVRVLLEAIGASAGAADKNGIWVSGFFGSGKSHFIKVLSYLLQNGEHEHDGSKRRAVDFFEGKLDDPMLYADLKKIVSTPTDPILFNVDSKADHGGGRDALLRVFLKVLNERQGYSGDHPHIAHMERYLDEKGKLGAFHAAFEEAAGAAWQAERDAWEFHRDQVSAALQKALGQSKSSVEAWVEGAESNFTLTVENFARWVMRYLEEKGPQQRVMFLVDEVGQFIGNDTHLMLSLQTITEQLGTVCKGRAWVVVTSQEDLEAVLGDVKNYKQHDFSKIQGRFSTRISLSSANVDEVIKRRLLEKNDDAPGPLAAAYEGKHDILRNQLSFVNSGMSFKTYADGEDFAACYPFAAYQFSLVQKVFESIRKAGATGLHLSQGERSTLDAFQAAAMQIGDRDVNALVPFHAFYPAVEGFLDTAVKRTIEQAADNLALKPFDGTILKLLFLIRYIDELPGSVDNLVTLCVDEIDADRLALRKQIEASLGRLESETLIARNGDLYFFLTNEERDIGREIKSTPVSSGAEERELGKLLFEDILGDVRKHTYTLTGRDFSFTRLCDDHPVGHRIEGSLEVAFVSPLGDSYAEYTSDERCSLHTTHEEARVLIRLPDDSTLGRELRTYLQTESYVKKKHTGSLPETTKRILRERSDENRDRRARLVKALESMMSDANYFARGQKLDITRTVPRDALADAMEYLIQNAYPKMGYIAHFHPNPKPEIQSTLRSNDIEQVNMRMKDTEANPEALSDLREYVELATRTSKQIVLRDLIEKRYGSRPYGWPELEVVLLVARLAVLKEISLVDSNTKAPIALEHAYDTLVSTTKQRKVIIVQRQAAGGDLIKKARALGKDLFAEQGPTVEDALYEFLRARMSGWRDALTGFEHLASTGQYPGGAEIRQGIDALRQYVEEGNSLRMLERFVANREELLELAEDIHELQDFYTNQKHSWEKLRAAVETFAQNKLQLDGHPEAGPALARMQEILGVNRPYGMLQESAKLIATVKAVNDELVDGRRKNALLEIQGLLDGAREDFAKAAAPNPLREAAIAPLEKLLHEAATTSSIAHIVQAREAAEAALDAAITRLEAHQAETTTGGSPSPTAPATPKIKPRRVIETKPLVPTGFIESREEMEAFLKKLREALEAALEAGERAQIK